MRDRKFHRLADRKEIDLVPYLRARLAEAEGIRLYIGTDSQNHGRTTDYASVIVLHYSSADGHGGGHVLYTKKTVRRDRDDNVRLWHEVQESVDLANFLVEEGFECPSEVHVDLNPDPKYMSNSLLRAALGYVESSGYHAVGKPDSFAASHVADGLLH